MKYQRIVLVILTLSAISFLHVQSQYLDHTASVTPPLCSGDFRTDLMMMPDANSPVGAMDSSTTVIHTKKYSPLRAALFSAVIPGAGQFYTKSYLQSALFAGAEVALWIFYSKYQSKGDQKTQDFQNYADANYSVVRYVEWIKTYYPTFYSASVSTNGKILHDDYATSSLPPWELINWNALKACESLIGADNNTVSGFSHQMPIRPDQQYYELIGKYPQFAGGWDDAWSNGTPTLTAEDVVNDHVSHVDDSKSHFLLYRNMRGDANSYYSIATTISYVLVANHVLGALEAAWNAAHLNSTLHASSSVQPRNVDGYHVDLAYSLNLQFDF